MFLEHLFTELLVMAASVSTDNLVLYIADIFLALVVPLNNF